MMPDVSRIIYQFGRPTKVTCTKTSVADFEATRKTTGENTITAVLQPIPESKLLVKPEGQRTWRWWKIWTTTPLMVGTIIKDDCRIFKVSSEEDWGAGGYYSYQLIEEPKKS